MASLAHVEGRTAHRDAPRSRTSAPLRGGDPLGGFRVVADGDCRRSLSQLIEREIIPRLMIAHADEPRAPVASAARAPDLDIEQLAELSLLVEADRLLAHVDALLAYGMCPDAVMVDLLAPTARLLGEYWESDRCDFVDVTMGLWRLQHVVHEIAARAPGGRLCADGAPRALFASMPGDQHDFGTVVIDEVFRRNGWTTGRMSEATRPDLLARADAEWFDLIGLTISCDCHIGALPSLIGALRKVSRNPRVRVMVGGRILSADPALAARVGADGTARDARVALAVATDLVRSCEGERLIHG